MDSRNNKGADPWLHATMPPLRRPGDRRGPPTCATPSEANQSSGADVGAALLCRRMLRATYGDLCCAENYVAYRSWSAKGIRLRGC